MGIPRLTKDLSPYLESVTLGQSPVARSDIHLESLVLDGPSVVYHVYGRLATYKSNGNSAAIDCVSYTELEDGVIAFFTELESLGVNLLKIFFDGALPRPKRPIRLERLEKSRQQIALYRQAHPILIKNTANTQLSKADISVALWSARTSTGPRSSNFTPPFIVPSVIDRLRKSKWAELVAIVPGEAESYCVPLAVEHDAGILTNDSDLVVYEDLAEKGTVVLLHSLTLGCHEDIKFVKAACWRPCKISESLGIDSLLAYAHLRYRDATASFASTVQSAKNLLDGDESKDFRDFKSEFHSRSQNVISQRRLYNLDPRVSELVCQIDPIFTPAPESDFYITLPVLFEDIGRDSSWIYGRQLRVVAYILLTNLLQSSFAELRNGRVEMVVIETFRKGQRIVQERLDISYPPKDLEPVVVQLKYLADLFSEFGDDSQALLLLWGLKLVIGGKESVGKSIPSQALLDSYLKDKVIRSSQPATEIGWEVIHLHANIQAVLYSLRTLCQLSLYADTFCVRETSGLLSELNEALGTLRTRCEPEGFTQALFLRADAATRLLAHMSDSAIETVLEGRYKAPNRRKAGPEQRPAQSLLKRDEAEFTIVPQARQKKRSKITHSWNVPKSKEKQQNVFDVLSELEASGDDF